MVPDRASADVAAAASGGHERSPHISSLHRPRDRGGWRGMAPDQSPRRIQPAGKNRGALRASAFPLRKRLCYVSTKQGLEKRGNALARCRVKEPAQQIGRASCRERGKRKEKGGD